MVRANTLAALVAFSLVPVRAFDLDVTSDGELHSRLPKLLKESLIQPKIPSSPLRRPSREFWWVSTTGTRQERCPEFWLILTTGGMLELCGIP